MKKGLYLMFFLMGAMMVSLTAGEFSRTEALDDGLEIVGLVIDETRTPIGRTFYEFFVSNWQSVEGGGFTLTITELADPLRGSLVTVMVNDSITYKAQLSPRADDIEESARKGVSRTRSFILYKKDLLKELEMY